MLSALLSLFVLLFSFFLDGGMEACLLCWLQRGIYALLIPFFLIAPRLLSLLLLSLGLTVALYHTGLVYGYLEDSCLPFLKALNQEELLDLYPCSKSPYIQGFALPLWNCAIFLTLFIKTYLWK